MKTMQTNNMKRLYTESESIRFFMIFPIIVATLNIILECIMQIHYVDRFFYRTIIREIKNFLLWEMIIFVLWYPKEYKLKRAMKNGKEYVGKIKSIDKLKSSRGVPFRNYIYIITVKVDVNGRLKTLNVGRFLKDPGKYFRIKDKCKVYKYKNKFYTLFLYSKKLSKEERTDSQLLTW